MIDQISDDLFVTNDRGVGQLRREAVSRTDSSSSATLIVESTMAHVELAMQKNPNALRRFGLETRGYAVLTTHREENVDVARNLR